MRIAIFSDTFLPQINGVAAQVYASAKGLAERGHDVLVITISKKTFADQTVGFEVMNLYSFPAMIYRGERFFIPHGTIYQKLKKFKPDVIHTHTLFGVGIEAVVSAKLLKIPVVGTHHTFFDHYLKYIYLDYEWMKTLSWKATIAYYNRCNLILSPSKALADSLLEHGLKRPIEILPYVIATDMFVPVDAAKQRQLKLRFGIPAKSIVYMGRLSYEKSIGVLIEAFRAVIAAEPQARLMLVGDGPEKENLMRLVKDSGLADKVIFTGIQRGPALAEAIQANDVFATASKSENLPVSVLEAISAGLPAVVADANGLPEIVRNEFNGFLIPPDDPAKMAKGIVRLLSDEALRAKFGANSRHKALEYSKDVIISRLETFYNQALTLKKS